MKAAKPLIIEPTSHGDALEALRILHFTRPQIMRLLLTAARQQLSLDGLFHARRGQSMVGAAWGQIMPGRVAGVWPAELVAQEPRSTANRLIGAVDQFLAGGTVDVAQSVLPAHHTAAAEQLLQKGFQYLADLVFMAWPVTQPAAVPGTDELTFTVFHPETDTARLATLLETTYLETKDCPQLDGWRNTSDVLEGYRQTGIYEPRLWQFVRLDQQDIGCLLLTDHPDVDQYELLYMGLIPAARGRGHGLRIVHQAQRAAQSGGRSQLVLAVDAANQPARTMYQAAGFQEADQRQVFAKRYGHSSEG